MTVEEAIKIQEENSKLTWHGKPTIAAEECQQMVELLKELKAHREAWGKAKRTVKAYLMLEEFGSEYQDDIEKLIEGCIPKEGDAE